MEEASGLPLKNFTKTTPPGWAPYDKSYPLRLYKQRLSLWYQVTDLAVGPAACAVAARLQGIAYDMALAIQIVTPLGDVLDRERALAYPGDPVNGVASGFETLLQVLTREFGALDQVVLTSAVDRFENYTRPSNSTLAQYLTEFAFLYRQAEQLGGYNLNAASKTNRLLRNSGLSRDRIDQIVTQEDGDLTRFDAIYLRLQRLAKLESDSQLSKVGSSQQKSYFTDDHSHEWPDDGEWWSPEADYYYTGQEDTEWDYSEAHDTEEVESTSWESYPESSDQVYQDSDDWEASEYYWTESDWYSDDWYYPGYEWTDPHHETYFGGPPMKGYPGSFGKSKGKGKGKKGKRKGKGKGKFQKGFRPFGQDRPPFGKGKGKSFGKR